MTEDNFRKPLDALYLILPGGFFPLLQEAPSARNARRLVLLKEGWHGPLLPGPGLALPEAAADDASAVGLCCVKRFPAFGDRLRQLSGD